MGGLQEEGEASDAQSGVRRPRAGRWQEDPSTGQVGSSAEVAATAKRDCAEIVLGLCNYYAGYVRMFAEYAAPLQEKLKLPRELSKAGSKHKLEWTEEEKQAFEKVKQSLVADVELHHIDPTKHFVLKTDASDYAVGAVLEQFPKITVMPRMKQIVPGASVPVGFMSRKLTAGQRMKWYTETRRRMPWWMRWKSGRATSTRTPC